MRYRLVAGVDDQTIAKAIESLLKAEEGDGLVNQMIELPFWESYLRKNWPGEMETNKQLHMEKLDVLEALKSAQRDWAQSTDSLPAERALRRRTLSDLAKRLPIAEQEVFTGMEMSTETYDRLLRDIGYQEKELRRQLTREAMSRAGI